MSKDTCDIIEVTSKQFDDMLVWGGSNKALLYEFKPLLTEGILNLTTAEVVDGTQEIISYNIYFEHDEYQLFFQLYANCDNYLYGPFLFNYNFNTGMFGIYKTSPTGWSDEEVGEIAYTTISRYITIMSYIYHFKRDIAETTVTERVRTNEPQWINGKLKSKIKISRTKYVVVNKINTRKVPKSRVWKCTGWTVRGHIRVLKTGKIVNVRPHVRGNKDNFKGKVYEI